MPPIANAGPDQIVAINPETSSAKVNFDGSGSSDPDGGTLNYAWNFGDGSTGSGEMLEHSYMSPDIYDVTLTVTDNDGLMSKDMMEVTVVSIEPQSVNDGETAQFTVLGATDATGYSWSWSAPNGARNDPKVTFSSLDSSATSVPRAKWFALALKPNRTVEVKACGTKDDDTASRTCKYTITCDITFPNNASVTATSSLTVNVPWGDEGDEAGYVKVSIGGFVNTDFNNDTQLWEVDRERSSLERKLYSTVKVPQSSYFYAKLHRHEEIHIEQLETGIASSYYSLDDLWDNHLQGLTNEKQRRSANCNKEYTYRLCKSRKQTN